ncbi:hypothetical protein Y032_0531g3012 [Ancylostoma ceylanicum]|uniref:Uncharacterized protein n=1 Tax=Ancylostoma ceylanicum TaxID=53326 RepID=A0A016WRY3_9BILA|nr:hypothetical protein Y032_0531g3012 [Ancylostoma ceylanicum]
MSVTLARGVATEALDSMSMCKTWVQLSCYSDYFGIERDFRMQQQLLEGITFPYDDATRRKLLILYKQKESLLDTEIVQEHLLSQPLLGIVLLLFAVLSLTTFLFAIIFIACRALGNCGAKRYQPHPTNGRRYVFYLALIILSWIGLAGATIHFISAGAELWNLPISGEDDADRSSLLRLQYQRHVVSQRDTEGKTVRQLFEDSDYAGDFEQLDTTTASGPSFITEPQPNTFSSKHGEFKNVKRVRHYHGRRFRMNATRPEIPRTSRFFRIEPKTRVYAAEVVVRHNSNRIPPAAPMRDVETNSLTAPPIPPLHSGSVPRQRQKLTFEKHGKGTIKAIRQPFVSDMWMNVGKQAFYKQNSTSRASGPLPSASVVVDNSVTRPDPPAIILPPEPLDVVEPEAVHSNTVANDGETALVDTLSSLVRTTTTLSSPSSQATTEDELDSASTTTATLMSSTSDDVTTESAEAESGTTTSPDEPENGEDSSETSQESTTEASIEASQDSSSETTTEALSSGEAEAVASGDESSSSIVSSGQFSTSSAPTSSEWTTEAEPSSDATSWPSTEAMPTTTTSTTTTTTTTTTATTPEATTTTTEPTTSTSTTTTTTTTTTEPTTTSTTTSTATTTTETLTTKIEDISTTEPTTVSTVSTTTTAVSKALLRKWQDYASEKDRLQSSSIFHITQLNSTASIRKHRKRLGNSRKARFESSHNTFPTETLLESSSEHNTTSAVDSRSTHEGHSSWAARIFVLFIGIIMVLLAIPTPLLITAGTVCYMRSYHPMDRTMFSEKIGQICVVLATVLLFFSPCIYLYLDVLLAYIHIYFAMCPAVELLEQFKSLSLEEFAILDGAMSSGNAAEHCQRNLETIQRIWVACFAFVLFSMPTVFALFKLSKYYLRMKTEYYWNVGDGYGVIRPKVATTKDAIYGNIYGTLQKKRPASKPPPRPVDRAPSEATAYGVYIDQPIYGAYQ